jgi:hypothetical protein
MVEREIEAWLSLPGSFAAGVDLIRRSGGSPNMQRYVEALQRAYLPPGIRQMLEAELRALFPAVTVSAQQLPLQAASNEPEPESVTSLREQGKALKKRESFLHAQMVILSQQGLSPERREQLYALAHELMEIIEPQLDIIYEAIKDYDKNGKVPFSEKEKVVRETVEKIKKRDSVISQVYRLRKQLKQEGLTQEEQDQLASQLAVKEAQLQQLDQELLIENV